VLIRDDAREEMTNRNGIFKSEVKILNELLFTFVV
tara:strand:+ start:303 stop:407 length:105 start_codon:yes stop_codon:yes gene_type:complete